MAECAASYSQRYIPKSGRYSRESRSCGWRRYTGKCVIAALLILNSVAVQGARVTAGQELQIGADVIEGSLPIDLANTTPGVSLLRAFALFLRDAALQRQINTEVAALVKVIANSLASGNAGYLLRVNVYTSEFGNVEIPGGQLLSLVGAGADPVDAMANYLGSDRVESSPPTGRIDSSSFVWVTRSNGQLVGRTIPREFRGKLIESGRQQLNTRRLQEAYRNSFTVDTDKVFRAAGYWTQLESNKASSVRDETRRAEIHKLTARMRELEDSARAIQAKYDATEREMASYAQRRDALRAAQTITSLVGKAVSTGDLRTAGDGTVSNQGGSVPVRDEKVEIEFTETMIRKTSSDLVIINRSLKVSRKDIESTDQSLSSKYKEEGIKLPPR
jgi:hypothetical protein